MSVMLSAIKCNLSVDPRPGNKFLNRKHFVKVTYCYYRHLKKQQGILLGSKGYIKWNMEKTEKDREKTGIT